MSESWIVTVEGRGYGPYTFEQMQAFIGEGRVLPHSLVGSEGMAPHEASKDPFLASLFQPASTRVTATSEPLTPAPGHKFGRHDEPSSATCAHMAIVADMKSGSVSGLEDAIFNLGQACTVLPQVWLLTTDLTINAVRNTLVQKLGKLDALFVIDSTHDKAAWFNFGPETDSRMRRLWTKPAGGERKQA